MIINKLNLYLKLFKPGILRMNIVTFGIGFVLARLGMVSPIEPLIWGCIGTALTSAGAAVINHAIEKESDQLMERTKERPIASSKVTVLEGLVLGVILSVFGVGLLAEMVNGLTAALAGLTIILYNGIYTPLKKWTWLNTFIGAIPGAIPPLGGWAAATGTLHPAAWSLFAIMLTWQHPHFYALALMYKEDYKKADLKMLPLMPNGMERTHRQIMIYTILLFIASYSPVFIGNLGAVYVAGMTVMNLVFLVRAIQLCKNKTKEHAKKLFIFSIIYLPIWLGLLMGDFYIG